MSLLGKEWYGEFIAHKDGFREGVEEGFKVGYEAAKKEFGERITGKWVFDKRFPHRFWFCTCCEWYNDYSNKEFKYCPNCGAKMEVDE